MQQMSWELMKIYKLKIYEIRYWSYFLLVTLHVSYVCFVKQAPGFIFMSFSIEAVPEYHF